jgi:hypothetical protein
MGVAPEQHGREVAVDADRRRWVALKLLLDQADAFLLIPGLKRGFGGGKSLNRHTKILPQPSTGGPSVACELERDGETPWSAGNLVAPWAGANYGALIRRESATLGPG